MKKICIIGSSGLAKETYWLLQEAGLESSFECFMEPDEYWQEKEIFGVPVRKQSEFDASKHKAVIGIGDSVIREKVVKFQLPSDTEYPTIIHPNVRISKWVELGTGAIICAGNIITCDITIGNFAFINLACTIGHDCVIGDYLTMNPGVNLSGICNLGNHVSIGTNAAVRQGVSICDNVVIGMGSNVVKNIKESGTYVGSPAKLLIR
jgi:sugar O-acyltransferase (sialic acid O-acetyltransferase NeuD family)